MTVSNKLETRRIAVVGMAIIIALSIAVPVISISVTADSEFTNTQNVTEPIVSPGETVTINVTLSNIPTDQNSVLLLTDQPEDWMFVNGSNSSDPKAVNPFNDESSFKPSSVEWVWISYDNTTFEAGYRLKVPANASDGAYEIDANGLFRNGTTDDNGDPVNFWSNTTTTVIVDSKSPSLSNASAIDQDGDRNVSEGDNITVSATASDAGAGVHTVLADASAFGAGNVSLTPNPNSSVYNATFSVNASQAAADGAQSITIVANDSTGKTNESDTSTLTLDTTAPAVTSATAVDAADGDHNVTDGDSISISADVGDMTTSVDTVTANASAFGAGSVTLTDDNGDGTFNASVTVNASVAVNDGVYPVAIRANDTVGNANMTATNNLTLDTKPPSITNPTLAAADGSGNVTGNDSVEVSADVTDAGVGVDHVSADASDFGAGIVNLSDSDGDHTYNATFTVNASQAAANGSYALTIAANDTLNNSASATSNELQLNTSGTAGTATETAAEPVSGQADGFGVMVAVLAFLLTGFAARRRLR